MTKTAYVPIRFEYVNREGTNIIYPQVTGLANTTAVLRMNNLIQAAVKELIEKQHAEQSAPYFQQMIGTFEIKNNQRGILSIVLSNYAYAPLHAHGLTLAKALTFSVDNGKLYQFEDLFKRNIDYENHLERIIQKQAAIREIPLLADKITLAPDQDFYLADKSLVVFFQAYEITPGYVGLPSFVIPEYSISPILKENGLLAALAEGL